MSPLVVCAIGIAALFILFLCRMPVAYVMGFLGILGFGYMVSAGAAADLLAKRLFYTFSDYGFTVIPLFVWMGFIALHGGIGEKLYGTAYKLIGEVRGGLAMATVLACTAFGAICGSSTATTATMGVVSWPHMRRQNYDASLATACVAAAGILGVMIPPSVVLIIYAFLVMESIPTLFIATIFPGLLLAVLYMLVIYIVTLFNPRLGPPGPRVGVKEKLLALTGGAGEILVIFGLVMGGLFVGLFTPTEAAAVGAASVLLVVLVRRQLTWQGFSASLADSTRTSAMILLIIAGAKMFGNFVGITGLPFLMAEWGSGLPLPEISVWGFILLAFLILGCFIDPLALMLLLLPIFLPLVLELGYDPVWLGPMLVLAGGMGVITPPVGMDVYVVSGVTDVPLTTVFRGIWPFLCAIIICIAICTAFPQIVLFLPGLLR